MSNLLNKFMTNKRDMPIAMSQWMRKDITTASKPDDVSSEEESLEIEITQVKTNKKKIALAKKKKEVGTKKAAKTSTTKLRASKDNADEVQITDVKATKDNKRKVPDEVRIVRITPPKKNKYKHMTRQELFGDDNEGFESDADKVDYYVIHSMCRRDGGNVLTYVPGYTALWRCPEYMKMMHQYLYHEIHVWCKEVKKFIHQLDNEWGEDPAFDTDCETKQKEHILETVNRMETTVLKKILAFNSVTIHTLCFNSIMMAFPGCGKRLAKLVKYICRSKSYHIRYFVVPGGKIGSYDIGTLLSIGHEWHFEQWDSEEIKED